MGNTSSQVAASQAPTQDVSLTSQPFSQVPTLDGTQHEGPQTRKGVASTLDSTVEGRVKKSKRKRTDGQTRAKRKSVPQHTRGFAIQPSQEIPDTQEEVQVGVGEDEEGEQGDVDADGVDIEAGISQPIPELNAAKRGNKARGKKRRVPWEESNKNSAHEDDLDHGSPRHAECKGAIDSEETWTSIYKPKKRKRIDVELERLQKDAEDFAPDLESTPKPRPFAKWQKQAKDVHLPDIVEEQPEAESRGEDDASPAKRRKRTKAAAASAGNASRRKLPRVNVSSPKVKVKKSAKVGAAAKRSKQVPQPKVDGQHDAENDENHSQVEDDAVEGAEEGPLADSIPTPPESAEVPTVGEQGRAEARSGADDAALEGAMEAGDQDAAHKGLALGGRPGRAAKSKERKRPEQPANIDQVEHPNRSDTQDASGKRKTNRKSITRLGGTADNEDDYHGDDHDDDDEAESEFDLNAVKAASKATGESKNKKKQSSSVQENVPKERGQIQGTWSKEERALADETFEDVVRVTAVAAWEIKANIVDWKHPTPHLQQLKDAFYEAFPKRDLKSIMRFCQRRYNTYDRGKWTKEQDELLREAYNLFPDQWTEISHHVSRFCEDCRGRWRDVLSRPEATAETGPWSREELLKLAKMVQECRELVVKETEDPEARDDPDKADALISWKAVADKMGNTRDAKRCREKWKQIKHQDLTATNAPPTTQPIQTGKSGEPAKRLQAAEKHYRQCQTGDVYDIMAEICSAVPDPGRIFEHETTFWSVVAMKNPDSRFNSSLRRLALASAMEQYGTKAVRKAETLAGKAKGVMDRMEALERKGEIEFTRVYQGKVKRKYTHKAKRPEKSADVERGNDGQPTKDKTESKGKDKQPSKARELKQHKSADLVVESDDEEVAADEAAEDDVVVEQTAAWDAEDESSHGHEWRARQETEERSLGSGYPGLSPSTFLERCTSGVKKGEGKAGSKKRKEGLKG